MSTKTTKKARPGLRTTPGEALAQAISRVTVADEETASAVFSSPDVVHRPTEEEPPTSTPPATQEVPAASDRRDERQVQKPEVEPDQDRDRDDSSSYDEDDEVDDNIEAERRAVAPLKRRRLRRYKPLPREDDVYRPYSVSLSDRQYEYISHIRMAEMMRLNRNISVAQVIRTLIDIGLENAEGTKIFDSRSRRRLLD